MIFFINLLGVSFYQNIYRYIDKNLKIIQEWWPDALKQNNTNPEDHLKFLQHIGYKIYEIDGTIKKDILPITIEQLLEKYPNSLIEDINLFCKKR